MKACILKPIIWNDEGYTKPSGYKTLSGFVAEHGFGFEEWNNSEETRWREQRIFHTEPINDALDFADGRLLMLIYANHSGQYAVGVAAGIVQNSLLDQKCITKELGLYGRHQDAWALKKVQNKFGSFEHFMEWWGNNFEYVAWRCPESLFYWFPQAQAIQARQFKKSGSLTNRYNKKVDVSRDSIASFLDGKLPREHAIWDWLAEDDFWDVVDCPLEKTNSRNPINAKKKALRGGGAVNKQISYWVNGDRTVEPYHATLQAAYVQHLIQQGFSPVENDHFIDIQFVDADGRLIYCEVKPTLKVESRYAIRIAVGQLLEYRFKNNQSARLRVVIHNRPTNDEELQFLKSLGIDIAYMSSDGQSFINIVN